MTTTSFFAHRQRLVSVFKDTMEQIQQSQDCQEAISYSLSQQQFISHEQPIDLPEMKYDTPAEIRVSRLRSFEAAAQYQGQHVAVLNFASATSPGGGVEKGASAQEEALCRVSTLFPCLKDKTMWESFYAPHRKTGDALHNDDVIYTPRVLVIKDDDLNLLPTPFYVDVITCAAPNLRDKPSNSYNPGDKIKASISDEDLLALHEQRAKKILAAAVKNGAEVLILGAFGCGAFKNDPHIVAQAYKNMLPSFCHYFRIIEFAVYCRAKDAKNYEAFCPLADIQREA